MPRDRCNGPGHVSPNRRDKHGDEHDSKAGDAMTARASVVRLRATETDRSYTLRSLCRNDFRFSDGPFGMPGDKTAFARDLAHLCRAHCPVIEQCAAELIKQAPVRPRTSVRAGVYFPDGGRPKVLGDDRCGPSCVGLPAVHRKAVAR